MDCSSPEVSPLRGSVATPAASHTPITNSPIHAASPQVTQQSIISMEDDDGLSDQEMVLTSVLTHDKPLMFIVICFHVEPIRRSRSIQVISTLVGEYTVFSCFYKLCSFQLRSKQSVVLFTYRSVQRRKC